MPDPIAPVKPVSHQRPADRAGRGARYSPELITALLKNADRADYGDALDTTAFQNKIGEHRHPQLRRPDPGTAGRLGAGSPSPVQPSLRLPSKHRPNRVNPKEDSPTIGRSRSRA